MDYRTLIASSLTDIGIEPDSVNQIECGAMIYGDAGLLDSVYLVALIAALEERLTAQLGTSVNLFSERGVALVDEFKDVRTLASFLENHVTGSSPAGQECWGSKQ